MKKEFFIWYNAKFINSRCSLKGALKFIKERGLRNGNGNCLSIIDREGQEYDPVTGEKIETE